MAENNRLDVDRIINHISYEFDKAAISHFGNTKPSMQSEEGTDSKILYDIQVELAYYLHNIKMGYTHAQHRLINKSYQFVDSIKAGVFYPKKEREKEQSA